MLRSVDPSSISSHSTESNPARSRGSSDSSLGRDSSSFRQGIWMINCARGVDRRVLREMAADDLEVLRIGQGPPVLFIHGSVVGGELTWRRQRELAERWRLIIPERPGFGRSPRAERGDFETEAP